MTKQMVVVSPDLTLDWDKYRHIMYELHGQIGRGVLTLDHLQAVVEHRNPFEERGGEEFVREVIVFILFSEAEKAAILILGAGKVLIQAQAKGQQEFPIRYSEDTLRACARENLEGGCDWRLVYLRGNSLREEQERVGTNRKRQPCFDKGYTWWLDLKEDSWATEKFEPGYYLIDFNGRFGRTSWSNQEKAIQELGPESIRAHEAMVTEAALRIFEATGERLLPNWYHWGRSLGSHGGRVGVGCFDSRGWRVNDYHPDWGDGATDYLRVCLLRKFQLNLET